MAEIRQAAARRLRGAGYDATTVHRDVRKTKRRMKGGQRAPGGSG